MAKMESTYRMTDRDIKLMIQLRAANANIFTGRKNSAMRGWRAIRKEMGIQGMLSAQQLKKKWDNLKDKYRALKNPPLGMETLAQTSSWRWFHLMDEAMSGRLAGTAAIVQPSPLSEDEEAYAALPTLILPKTEAVFSDLSVVETGSLEGVEMLGDVLELSGMEACGSVEAMSRTQSPAEAVDGDQMRRSPECETQPVMIKNQTAVLYSKLLSACTFQTSRTPSSYRPTIREDAGRGDAIREDAFREDAVREDAEDDGKLVELQREWRALEREQAEFDRELIALERDREMLNRDMATLERGRVVLERDRAAVERDRAAVERDRVVLDRDRAFLDRDRAFLDRDRVFLERAREDLERERALLRRERAVLEREGAAAVDGHQVEMTTEKEVVLQTRFYQSLMAADLDLEQLETRQRLLSLFQRLVEKL
ncbi:uncharacterized protein LOC119487266 [Sebastes umbrosus]|uniref:uncharacterized protein LOC119487266 n=1 Tax=Sebastes umbrosus TaxID=72105 RepID=UPI0018A115E3|nr:uncharacterized protein LOC119487266 [Sebastes umbrosus]